MRKYLAELVGTFILVFVGTGAVVTAKAVSDGQVNAAGVAAIGIAFAIALASIAYSLGPVSGAHVNPAVTIGLALERRIEWKEVVPYIVSQCIGAVGASLVLWVLTRAKDLGLGETTSGIYGNGGALGMEIVATALFLLVILAVTSSKAVPGFGGLIIGLFLGGAQLFAIPFSGASLNPARSLGPAVFVGGEALGDLWLYIVGPVVGAVIGVILYELCCRNGGESRF